MNHSSGQTLGKYRILEKLGYGGFADVYHAVDTVLDHEVALKILRPDMAGKPDVLRRFQQEARVTAKLFHPNIVSFFETGELNGRQFIAMRYIHGQSLHTVLESQTLLPLAQVVAIAEQIGAALDYAHTQGVIHRDVKPNNIILDAEGRATLMDFGIVKSLEKSSIETTLNTVVGTPNYLSPEQAESQPVDGRADVYALGAVVYHLLTGQTPFLADTTPSLLYKIVHEPPIPPPASAGPRIAGEIERVVLKSMAKAPADRYASCGEFAAALGQAVQKLTTDTLNTLRKQAATALADENFAEAAGALQQVLAIQPEDLEAQRMQAELGQQQAAAARYTQLAEKMTQLRAEAAELQAHAPAMRDPDGVLRTLRGASTPAGRGQKKAPVESPLEETTAFIQRLRGWLLALGVFSLPIAGMGLLGIIGSLAMGKRKSWGRKTALGLTLVLILGTVVATVVITIESVRWWILQIHLWVPIAFAQTLFTLSALLATGLRRRDVLQAFGDDYRAPAELWPIALPLLFTGIGTIPAIGLLARKNWARVAAQGVLALLCLAGMLIAPAFTIGAAWAISRLRAPEFKAWVRGEW